MKSGGVDNPRQAKIFFFFFFFFFFFCQSSANLLTMSSMDLDSKSGSATIPLVECFNTAAVHLSQVAEELE
ncbi:hypothetical protein F5884DRAFT_852426 [Xylogone sp. PMI_703]|nr:hypothetical protein F5884DRAFT_852426 [Xylogone sp. PMI_703]